MKKNWLNNFKRFSPENFDRSKYLRLDKNERVVNFNKLFLSKLKKKLNSFEITAYPNIQKTTNLIAKKFGVSSQNICLTAGSDFGLRMCFEFFCKETDKIICLEPTFGMVEVYSNLFKLKNIKIGYDYKLNLDFKKFYKNLNKKISLVVIANPNSPTGTVIDEKILKKIITKTNQLGVPLVIDEAYYGFYKKTYLKLIKTYKNIIILRTFSKSYGLAGLRAGFIACNKATAKNLFKFRPMYEINSISCIAIEFLLKNTKLVQDHIKHVQDSKKFLINELKKINYKYLNTHANFFHIDLRGNKRKFEKILKQNKILVRKGPGVKGYESFLRFSLGSVQQMSKITRLLKSLK